MSSQPDFKPGTQSFPAAESAEVLDLFGVFRRRKSALIFGVILGLAAAGVYYVVALPQFEAELRVLLMFKDPGVAARGTTNNPDREGGQVAEQALATHMEVFTSRRIVKQAFEEYNLEQVPSLHAVIQDGDDPIEYIQENVAVEMGGSDQDAKATIMSARFMDPSPEHCATVLNSMFAAYQDFLGKTYRSTGDQAYQLVQKEKEKLKQELADAQKKFKVFRENAPLQWTEEGPTNLHQTRVAEIERSLAELNDKIESTLSRQRVVEETLARKDPSGMKDYDRLALLGPDYTERLELYFNVSKGDVQSETFQKGLAQLESVASAKASSLIELKRRKKRLESTFGEDYDGLRVVKEEIATVELELERLSPILTEREVERLTPSDMLVLAVSLMENDRIEHNIKKERLEGKLSEEMKKAQEMAGLLLEADALEKELTRKQKLYDTMVARSGDVHLLRDYGGFQAEVIAAAEPQKEVAWPRLPLVLAGGLILGLFLGSGMAIFQDFADSTFRGPEQLQDVMGVNIGAHIPYINIKRRELKSADVDPSLVMFHKPQSPEAECFRSLRTSLLFDSRKNSTQLVGFTSPTPGDGKSTTAANFACCLAQSGKKVLLIDGDLRRPRVGHLLGGKENMGLAEVLVGAVELPDAMVDHPEISNLSVLSSGGIPPNPAELLMSEEFEQLLDVVRQKFDFIFIDLPPLLAVSDPAIVAPLLDGLIFVMRVVKNGQKPAFKAKKMIDDLEARVICAVVNGSDQSGTPYGYADVTRQDYRYGYSYGDGYENREYFRKEKRSSKKAGV